MTDVDYFPHKRFALHSSNILRNSVLDHYYYGESNLIKIFMLFTEFCLFVCVCVCACPFSSTHQTGRTLCHVLHCYGRVLLSICQRVRSTSCQPQHWMHAQISTTSTTVYQNCAHHGDIHLLAMPTENANIQCRHHPTPLFDNDRRYLVLV